MKLQFSHAGVARTLVKHPGVMNKLKTGAITESQAAATSWYLRFAVAGKERSFNLGTDTDSQAIRAAKDILNGRAERPNDFAAFLQDRDSRRAVTIGQLAEAWITNNCPFDQTDARTPDAAQQLKSTVHRALPWWKDKPVTQIRPGTLAEYVLWRRQNNRAVQLQQPAINSGTRSADLELAALSSLCKWAVACEKITANPFANRKSFQKNEDIRHCHDAMPDNDDQFHAILRYMITSGTQSDKFAACYLAFCALTGLRPGEPILLQNIPRTNQFPNNFKTAPAGLIYPTPDGQIHMKVKRLKRGQNPAITLRPALVDFLDHYQRWLPTAAAPRFRQPIVQAFEPLFPIPIAALANALRHGLRRATAALKLKTMKPHGFGRAYYVRVRRSQGVDDSTIAVELGQNSQGELIRSVYGDPLDPVGGNLHDWLPSDPNATPAWHLLTQSMQVEIPTNIIAL